MNFLDATAPAVALSRRLRLTKAHLRELLRGGVEGWRGLLSLVSLRKSFKGIEPSSTGPSTAAVYCHHWPSASSHTMTTAAQRASRSDVQPAWDLCYSVPPDCPQGQATSFMGSSAVHRWELAAATPRKPNECRVIAEALPGAQDSKLDQQSDFSATPCAYQVINVQ